MKPPWFDAALYDAQPALRRYALNLTREADQASDLVQDTCVRALTKCDLFDDTGGNSFERWCFTIMRNLFFDRMRKKKMRGELPLPEKGEFISPVATNQIDAVLIREVLKLVQTQFCEYEIELLSMIVNGAPYHQIAQAQNTPTGTIKSRLSRARCKLERLIGGHYDEEAADAASQAWADQRAEERRTRRAGRHELHHLPEMQLPRLVPADTRRQRDAADRGDGLRSVRRHQAHDQQRPGARSGISEALRESVVLITPVPLPPRASITIQPVPVDDDEIRELIRLKLVELRKPQKYLADALGISLPWLWHMMGPNKREFGKYREPILAWLNEPARMSA